MTRESVYLDWLRDAHAMEKHGETLLKQAMERLDSDSSIGSHIAHYLAQSRTAVAGERGLKCHDDSWSALKEALGRLSVVGQAASDLLRVEQDARMAVSVYVFCSYKVATYTTLIAAARQADDREGDIFQRILQQEGKMAARLLADLPEAANQSIDSLAESEASSAV
ncbi:ferritin-like domain-containing protein (plasmid) [Pseudomonas silvicola]|nr:ferritin-like domain-containing protein [Pseudomonas silvicola]